MVRLRHSVGILPGIVVFLGLTGCQAPPPPETPELDARLEGALTLLRSEGPEPALPEFRELLGAYRTVGSEKGEAITLGHIGTCYKNLGQFDKAIEFQIQALAKKRRLNLEIEVAKTLSNLGLAYWELGDYELAAGRYEESLAIARHHQDQRIEAAVVNNLGLVYDEWGDYRRSLEAYHSALEMQRSQDDKELQSSTLANIGGVHLLLGHFQTALDYYKQALDLSRELGYRPSETIDLGNLAICYLELGQAEVALQVLDEALAVARETGQLKEQAYWQGGKGSAFARLGRYAEALNAYQSAYEIYRTAEAKKEIAEALSQIGMIEMTLGDVTGAERRFEEALAVAREVQHHREVTNGLIALGQSARLSGRLDRAEKFFTDGLTFARDIGDKANESTSLLHLASLHLDRAQHERALENARRAAKIADETGSLQRQVIALKLLGDARFQQGDAQAALQHYEEASKLAGSLGDPEIDWQIAHAKGRAFWEESETRLAIAQLVRSIETIEESRFQLETRRDRAGFLEQRFEPYIDLVRLLVSEKQPESALHYAERLRASLLFENQIQISQPVAGGEQVLEFRSRVRHLRALIRQEQAKSAADRRPKALSVYRSELADAEQSYRRALRSQPGATESATDSFTPVVPPTSELRAHLPRSTALLEYLQAEEELFLFVMTNRHLSAVRIPASEAEVSTRIEVLLELIGQRAGEAWIEPAKGLYALLIQPAMDLALLENIDKLYLVPHSNLHYLPFAVLAKPAGPSHRLLVDDFELSYLPSAALLAQSQSGAPHRSGGLLVVAPDRPRLEFIGEEVESIARAYEGDSVILAGAGALESELYRLASDARIIHIATHARFDKLNPMRSSLDLQPGEGQDGRLEVAEIRTMRISADLVTLSACETALGGGFFKSIPPGDDFVGLTRAFLAAGSRSVLASLWRVNDRSTSELMAGFYSRWEDRDPAQALASTQRELRTSNRGSDHPYYWAGFVLTLGSGASSF